jgi:uncharacterized SAM-binding protein YcdF (DUF218 family)
LGGTLLTLSVPAGHPDAIVVLASHEHERLPVAAELARRYASARVLLTYPDEDSRESCQRCSERTAWLAEAGVDGARVTVLPQQVASTYDEGRAAAAFASRHRIERLIIVTSPYHTRRALATFRHLFAAAGVPTLLGIAAPWPAADPERWWLREYDRDYVAYEWTALVYYAIRFGVWPIA